jgi:GPH family glycoside/pentoside/hexuronide:cation symporter
VRRTPLIATTVTAGTSLGNFSTLSANKPFIVLAIAYFVALTGQAITYTVFGLYFIFVMKSPDALIAVNVPAALSVIVAQPATLWLTRRLTKRTIYVVGIVGWSVLSLSWLVAGPGEAEAMTRLLGIQISANMLLGLRGFLWGMFNAMYVLMALSMLTDTIAADRKRTGRANSGLFAGVFSAVEKVAFALGPAIAGLLLSLGGFIEDRGGGHVQSANALVMLVLCFTVIPAVFKLSSLLLLARYQLHDADID